MELSENVQLIETKYGKISQSPEEFAWDQRYRPTTIDECILPAADKATMRGFIKSGRIDNMTLVSDSPVRVKQRWRWFWLTKLMRK